MAIQPEEKTWLAEIFGFDSNRNFIYFKIDDATDEKIAGRYTNNVINHPEDYGFINGGTYKGVAMWEDSAGEVQLSSDCTEITE